MTVVAPGAICMCKQCGAQLWVVVAKAEVNGIPPGRRFLEGNRTRIEHSKSDAGAAN